MVNRKRPKRRKEGSLSTQNAVVWCLYFSLIFNACGAYFIHIIYIFSSSYLTILTINDFDLVYKSRSSYLVICGPKPKFAFHYIWCILNIFHLSLAYNLTWYLSQCDREICFATKKGYATSDGKIDKEALKAVIEKDFADNQELMNNIIDKCVDGDLEKYGKSDMCDLMKLKMCMDAQFVMVSWLYKCLTMKVLRVKFYLFTKVL